MASPYYGAGTGPYGTSPFGTMSSPLPALVRAEAIAENRVRLTFVSRPLAANQGLYGDVHRVAHYEMTPIESTRGMDGLPPRPVTVIAIDVVDDLTIDIILDRPMSPFPSGYDLMVEGLVEHDTHFPIATAFFILQAVFKGIPPTMLDLIVDNRDIANPQTRDALFDPLPIDGEAEGLDILGTYPIDALGDVAHDEGIPSYKKRVYRRLTTRKNAFAHLPGYGTAIPGSVKQLSRSGSREVLCSDAEDQIMREPESRACSVRVQQSRTDPHVFYYIIRVQVSIGRTLAFAVQGRVG